MICKKISVEGFRNIKTASIEFSPGVNIITGNNAQGKTNLLESIYIFALGKSFRGAKDNELIGFSSNLATISLDYESKSHNNRLQNMTIRYANVKNISPTADSFDVFSNDAILAALKGKKRMLLHNNVNVKNMSDIIGNFRCVLFSPEHLSIIKDGPSVRRNFLDVAISQSSNLYLRSLQRYNLILLQRNKLLKDANLNMQAFSSTIELWSEQLSKEAAIISSFRAEYCAKLDFYVREIMLEMSCGTEETAIIYQGGARKLILPKNEEFEFYKNTSKLQEFFFLKLQNNLQKEISAGTTLYGPHRDDFDILISGHSSRVFASQGQQRSLALALKLSEGKICCDDDSVSGGELPVFLLDDVLSELDIKRRAYLTEKIKDMQVIMTTCEENYSGGDRVFTVESGVYRQIK